MDRHHFVEKLLSERKALQEKRDELESRKSKAYSRSVTRFREMLMPDQEGVYVDVATVFTGHVPFAFNVNPRPDEAKVTDSDIKALCAELKRLEDHCVELESEAIKYEYEDFVGRIMALVGDE